MAPHIAANHVMRGKICPPIRFIAHRAIGAQVGRWAPPAGWSPLDIFSPIALRIEEGGEIAMVDPRMSCCGHGRLGVKGYSKACFGEHGKIVGAIAHRERLGGQEAMVGTQLEKRSALCFFAEYGLCDQAGQFAIFHEELIGLIVVEADHGGDPIGEKREAAGYEGRVSPMSAHRPDECAAARRQSNALGNDFRDDLHVKVLEQGDAFAQSGLEGYFAAHGAFRYCGDMGLHADEIGELVDAFLADHGRIHVRQEKSLAPIGSRLDDDVDRRSRELAAQYFYKVLAGPGAPRRKKDIGCHTFSEPLLFARFRQKLCRTLKSRLVKGACGRVRNERCYVNHDYSDARTFVL
jgi:hypothetical protein